MAQIVTTDGLLGTPLEALLKADHIRPGHGPSYQLCKTIYEYHPHGAKIVDFPVQMAMHKPRKITVPGAPDDGKEMVTAFTAEWKALLVDGHILNTARQARMYGVATAALLEKGRPFEEQVDFEKLADAEIGVNVFDPLNTAGSLVLSQDPNSLDFQKVPGGVTVNGKAYHRSRTVTLMNEDPLYISYTSAGFGFLGRSVYQRALVALKSFLFTMDTDAMVAVKAGLLIAKMQSQSSAVDGPMAFLFGGKRQLLKEAQTGNVLSIDIEEEIESLNLQNIDGAGTFARRNILENEAAGSGTPAKIVLAETFAEGFGEGTEDAKAIAQYIDGVRFWLQPLYSFFDPIVMHRAWNAQFFERMKRLYPEDYAGVDYTTFFQGLRNAFKAVWPNLLEEPESEKLKGEDVILKAMIAVVEILIPVLDPVNKATAIEWLADNCNERKLLFSSPLELNYKALAEYEPPVPTMGGGDVKPAPPESGRDSAGRGRVGPEVIGEVDRVLRQLASQLPDASVPRLVTG